MLSEVPATIHHQLPCPGLCLQVPEQSDCQDVTSGAELGCPAESYPNCTFKNKVKDACCFKPLSLGRLGDLLHNNRQR